MITEAECFGVVVTSVPTQKVRVVDGVGGGFIGLPDVPDEGGLG